MTRARGSSVTAAGGAAGCSALWVEHPERVLSTLLIVNTLVNIGAGALAAAIGDEMAAAAGWNVGATVAVGDRRRHRVILFVGEIIPKTLGKRHPVQDVARRRSRSCRRPRWRSGRLSSARRPARRARSSRVFGGARTRRPAVTSEEIEYLIEMGTREGVLDEVKEELLNSVLEFADRVAREIMVPRTRMVAIESDAPPDELFRFVTENPFSRMPVYEGSVDNVVGILLVREIIRELARGPEQAHRPRPVSQAAVLRPGADEDLAPAQGDAAPRTHLAIVVDEFGGTSGLVTLEDCIEEIVGEIQDEADVEAAPVQEVAPGVWLADGAIPLHDLEEFLNDALEPGDRGADAGRRGPLPRGGRLRDARRLRHRDRRAGAAGRSAHRLGRAHVHRARGRRAAGDEGRDRPPRATRPAREAPGAAGRRRLETRPCTTGPLPDEAPICGASPASSWSALVAPSARSLTARASSSGGSTGTARRPSAR